MRSLLLATTCFALAGCAHSQSFLSFGTGTITPPVVALNAQTVTMGALTQAKFGGVMVDAPALGMTQNLNIGSLCISEAANSGHWQVQTAITSPHTGSASNTPIFTTVTNTASVTCQDNPSAGSGATASWTVSGGVVNGYTLGSGGSGYYVGENVSLALANAILHVGTVDANGSILTLVIDNGGTINLASNLAAPIQPAAWFDTPVPTTSGVTYLAGSCNTGSPNTQACTATFSVTAYTGTGETGTSYTAPLTYAIYPGAASIGNEIAGSLSYGGTWLPIPTSFQSAGGNRVLLSQGTSEPNTQVYWHPAASSRAFSGSAATCTIDGTALTVSGATGALAFGQYQYLGGNNVDSTPGLTGHADAEQMIADYTQITAGSGTSWTISPSQGYYTGPCMTGVSLQDANAAKPALTAGLRLVSFTGSASYGYLIVNDLQSAINTVFGGNGVNQYAFWLNGYSYLTLNHPTVVMAAAMQGLSDNNIEGIRCDGGVSNVFVNNFDARFMDSPLNDTGCTNVSVEHMRVRGFNNNAVFMIGDNWTVADSVFMEPINVSSSHPDFFQVSNNYGPANLRLDRDIFFEGDYYGGPANNQSPIFTDLGWISASGGAYIDDGLSIGCGTAPCYDAATGGDPAGGTTMTVTGNNVSGTATSMGTGSPISGTGVVSGTGTTANISPNSGTGATATWTASGGAITAATIVAVGGHSTASGNLYTVGDNLTATLGGSGAVLRVATIDGSGGVTGLTVVSGGTGYSTNGAAAALSQGTNTYQVSIKQAVPPTQLHQRFVTNFASHAVLYAGCSDSAPKLPHGIGVTLTNWTSVNVGFPPQNATGSPFSNECSTNNAPNYAGTNLGLIGTGPQWSNVVLNGVYSSGSTPLYPSAVTTLNNSQVTHATGVVAGDFAVTSPRTVIAAALSGLSYQTPMATVISTLSTDLAPGANQQSGATDYGWETRTFHWNDGSGVLVSTVGPTE
ncbi:MAG TPA: hypothetical protein VG248_03485 [Caulobacteraceae bacterium]|nr:hypothetical protein [Caulobacteraceae bacterium]